MDMWFFYDVTHSQHTWCNPVSAEGVCELEAALDLKPGQRVLDIASGHGEMLIGFCERHRIRGMGVDASPYAIRHAEARKELRVPNADLVFLLKRAEHCSFEGTPGFDVVMCIGASWIWDGWAGTLDALLGLVRPGGLVVTGEPFWKAEPPASYLEAENLTADQFPTLGGYWAGARARGLSLVWMRGATESEWDRYEMQQTVAFDRFRTEHPDHRDLEEIEALLMRNKEAYLTWGRAGLGFAISVWRTPGAAEGAEA